MMTIQRIISVLLSSMLVLTQLAACAPKPAPHMFDSRVNGDEDGDGDDNDGGDDEGGDDEGDEGDDEGDDSAPDDDFNGQSIKTDGEGRPLPEGKATKGGTYKVDGNVTLGSEHHEIGERVEFQGEGYTYSEVVSATCDDCTVNGVHFSRFHTYDNSTFELSIDVGGPSVKDNEPMTKESEEFFEGKGGSDKPRKEGSATDSPKEQKPAAVSPESTNAPKGLAGIREFMKEERQKIQAALDNGVKESSKAREESRGSAKGYANAHNEGIDALSKALPGAKSRGKSPSIKTPEGSPLGDSMRRTARYISYVENEGNGDRKLTGLARKTLEKADEKAQDGDLTGAEKRRKAAQDLADSAACQGCKPAPAGPAPKDVDSPLTFDANKERSYAYDMGTGMYGAANDLDDAGLPEVADETRKTAAKVMNVALGLARMSNLLDVPMSAAEAFCGVTVDIDDQGNPRVRDATNIERAVGAVSLGLIATAAVLGAGVGGVVAAGVIGKIGKVIRGGEKGRALEKAALEAAEKGLVGAEKEALEKAAAELAEKNANDIAKDAAKIPKELEELGENAKNWSTKPPNKKTHPNGLDGPLNALKHAEEHLKEFPECVTKADYVKKAQDFVKNPPAGSVQKTRANGDTVIYEGSTNTFGVKNSSGQPKTMMRPTDGRAYYDRQK